jgi:hypothetical protein
MAFVARCDSRRITRCDTCVSTRLRSRLNHPEPGGRPSPVGAVSRLDSIIGVGVYCRIGGRAAGSPTSRGMTPKKP